MWESLNKPIHVQWDYERGKKGAENTFQEIMAENIPQIIEKQAHTHPGKAAREN